MLTGAQNKYQLLREHCIMEILIMILLFRSILGLIFLVFVCMLSDLLKIGYSGCSGYDL
jgi:hypothetical protein